MLKCLPLIEERLLNYHIADVAYTGKLTYARSSRIETDWRTRCKPGVRELFMLMQIRMYIPIHRPECNRDSDGHLCSLVENDIHLGGVCGPWKRCCGASKQTLTCSKL